MLQQILRDMWVDPEILAELDEAQKQTLFCKMREEQVRRWQIWDQKVNKTNDERPKIQKDTKKQVSFLKGEDGEPWVWVMGEHPNDKSIETILAEEARQRALAQARQEAHQLRKSVEKELTQLIDYKPLDSLEQKFELSPKTVESIENTLEIYCSVDELRQRIDELEPRVELSQVDKMDNTEFCSDVKLDLNKSGLHFSFIEGKRDVLQELGIPGGGDGVGQLVAAWERRVAAARAGDILRGLRARRARALRDAHINAINSDAAWREQERKAKEAEAARRSLARAARAEHRRSTELAPPPHNTHSIKPPNREAVVEWFRTQEVPRGVGLDENKQPVDWFHGAITRYEAEQVLQDSPPGSFLVRVSERACGYALSLRTDCAGSAGAAGSARCRHYLVERALNGYRLLGSSHTVHNTLADLVNHHKVNPLTESGGELLVRAQPPLSVPAHLTAAPPSCSS